MVRVALVVMLAVFTAAVPVAGGQEPRARNVAVERSGTYSEIPPAVLNAMLGRKDFLLVNVHIPYAGEISGTDRFIPFDEIKDGRATLTVRKDAKIVLYCRSGPMSVTAARALVRAGYTNVSVLAGGMNAWEDAGLAINRGPR